MRLCQRYQRFIFSVCVYISPFKVDFTHARPACSYLRWGTSSPHSSNVNELACGGFHVLQETTVCPQSYYHGSRLHSNSSITAVIVCVTQL